MEMVKVESSHVLAIGYDETSQVMRVEYNTGTYDYFGNYMGVPKEAYDKIMTSESKGRALKEAIAEYGLRYKKVED